MSLIEQLDPYGDLEYVIGDDDYFIAIAFTYQGDRAAVRSVLNCESGGFIQDFLPAWEGPGEELYEQLHYLVEAALDTLAENGVEHDHFGWNQAPAYVRRAGFKAVHNFGLPAHFASQRKVARRFTDSELKAYAAQGKARVEEGNQYGILRNEGVRYFTYGEAQQ